MLETVKCYANKINRQIAFHFFLLWLLTTPAVMPLFQPTLTRSADGLLHLYRVVALEHALNQGGPLFPRWLPDLAYGYGFPLFVYYAPLAYYITLILNKIGLGAVAALNGSFILALFLAAGGAYLFVKDLFGPKAGLLAGVAYVYAPFQVLNALSRGGLPAAWAMAMFPFVFWTFGRLLKQNRFLPTSSLILGAALLMHNTLNLLFVPLFALYLVVELGFLFFSTPLKIWRQTVLRISLAGLLALGLAAFFLIPAIAEKDYAQVQRVIISPDFDFRFHFVTLKELFWLPQPANTGLLNPRRPFSIGLAQLGLALIGFIGLIRNIRFPPAPRPSLPILAFTSFAIIISIFMMLPFSTGVWERIPLLAFVQFPHRLLGPLAFVLSTLAGAATAALPQRAAFGLIIAGIVLIFITAVPLLYPRYLEPFAAEPTHLDMMAYEHAGGTIGTTSFGEYLPIWVKQTPGESPLEPMYRANATIARLDSSYLPSEATVESATYAFNQADLIINAPQPVQAIFHTFYFPGWTATLDGQSASVAPVTERGLIGVTLPEGRHHLKLFFQETRVRRLANGISILALVLIAMMSVMSVARSAYCVKVFTTHHALRTTPGFNPKQLGGLIGLAITLIALKAFYLDRFDNPLKQTFDGSTAPQADVSTDINFGHQVNLLGYDLSRKEAVSGETFDLTLYWQARQPLAINYSALAQLVDENNNLYAGQDNLHPGSLPTTLWQSWGFAQDPHLIRVPPGTPPGDYFLVTGLYNSTNGFRLPVVEGAASGWADVITIPVVVKKAEEIPTIEALDIRWPAAQTCQVLQICLLGATPERETIPRNDFLRIALFWEATTTPTLDYQISLRLLALDGTPALEQTSRPSHNRYPTTLWSAGERIRDNHAVWIPPDFPAGEYRLQAQVLDERGQPVGEWVELGSIGVTRVSMLSQPG